MPDCIFCKIASGEIPAKTVYEDERIVAFEDINPVAPTHILIIPRKHISTLSQVPEEDTRLLGHMMALAPRLAAQRGIADSGYRVVMNTEAGAGQTVFHIHLHLLGGRGFTWPPG